MASTIAFYLGDGTTTDFTVPFDYLKKSFVTVRLGPGTTLTGGDYGDTGSDYYFLDKTTIRLKVAPASGESLTIRRYTSATERVVTFKDASILKATDLDASQVQAFHIAEEGRDILEDSLSVNREGNWDAKGKRIINVGDAVSDGDAVNLKLYKEDAKGTYQSKLDAERARDRAVEAETNAKESEANAKLSEVTAQASAGTAVSASKHADTVKVENQAILQESREIIAENKVLNTDTKDNANVAQVKANEAKVSEANAKRQADLAKDYADQASAGQIQADWNQTDSTQKSFIRNKPNLGSYATTTALTEGLAGKANKAHTHAVGDVTGLQSALDGKQPKGSYATTTALTEALNKKENAGVCLPLTGGTLTGQLFLTETNHIWAVVDDVYKGLELGGGSTYKDGASLFLRNNNATGPGESGLWGLAAHNVASDEEGILIGRTDNIWFNGKVVERADGFYATQFTGGYCDAHRYVTGLQIITAGITIPANRVGVTLTFAKPFINDEYSVAACGSTHYGNVTITWDSGTATSIKLYRADHNGAYSFDTYTKCVFIGRWL